MKKRPTKRKKNTRRRAVRKAREERTVTLDDFKQALRELTMPEEEREKKG